MKKLMIKITLAVGIFVGVVACSSAPVEGDRKLSYNEIPSFLNKYKRAPFHDVEFYEKGKTQEGKFYEVKYDENDHEISIAFDRDGKIIEREMDLKFEELTSVQRKNILNYLKREYPGFVILEVERRVENEREFYIDVEIRHHSSESGYWELSFDEGGDFKEREVEDHQQIETLN